MPLIFDGYTITAGVSPFFGSTDDSRGRISGQKMNLKDQAGIGASWDPFSIEIPCDCAPQPGDWITVTSRTILFVDISTITYSLCGGACSGTITQPGFAVGLEIKRLKWVV